MSLRFGGPAPDFTLPSSEGSPVSLSSLRGREVVLAFYCYDWGNI
jgi:thioredoxin-dependent peroxiredoxin